jgi:hypothetical protein
MNQSLRHLRMCVDRVVPLHLKARAAQLAIGEHAGNNPGPLLRRLGASLGPAKIALFTGKMWSPGRTLRVSFLDGSAVQRSRVQEKALEWCDYANITLDFNGDASSEIRISFQADPGSWSAIGTDCLASDYFKPGTPTMNFGWLTDDTDDEEYRRVVVHEFGHALGAIHEHQNPFGSSIQWNTDAVYQYFGGPPNNWSKEEVDVNVLQKYSVDQLNGTAFDSQSIMLYSFPAELTLNGVGTPNNTDLSNADKTFIASAYPGVFAAPAPVTVSGPGAAPGSGAERVEIITRAGNHIFVP